MKIGIDVRHLAGGPKTGVGVVTDQLVLALFHALPKSSFAVFYNGWNAPPQELAEWEGRENVSVIRSRIPNRFFDVAAMSGLLRSHARELNTSDVHISPHMLPLPQLSIPRILVLHDLSFVRYPDLFSPRRRAWHARIRPYAQAQAATRIVVPSYATKRDVVELWKIPDEKIHVIPWGTPPVNTKAPGPGPKASSRTILFLGTMEKRKNVKGLIEAFAQLQASGRSDMRLVLAGDLGWGSGEVLELIKKLQDPGAVEIFGYVNEDTKRRLFLEADMFVYPSLYEGSALPPLEAMAAGVPTIVARNTALPEICGDAVLLVDPMRSDEIALAITQVADDHQLADDLAARGRVRAQTFTWEKTAASFCEVINEVLA